MSLGTSTRLKHVPAALTCPRCSRRMWFTGIKEKLFKFECANKDCMKVRLFTEEELSKEIGSGERGRVEG